MTPPTTKPPATTGTDPLAPARELLRTGRLREAAEAAQKIADADPNVVEALYVVAVACRYMGRADDALSSLAQLLTIQPRYARAFQEQGHVLKANGNVHGAARAFESAVKLNRGLVASWRELAQLYRQLGNDQAAKVAAAEHGRLAALPPELVSVTSMIEEGRLYQAEQLCRAFLQANPHHIEGMRLLALLGIRLSIYDDAEFLLESCVELAPDYWLARFDYVNILHRRQKFEKALEQATILRQRFPGNQAFELAYANENVAIGQFDTALEVYDQVIAAHPSMEQPHLSRGHALKTLGRLEDGIESYRNAYRARADFGDAYWSLANLKTYRFSDDEIGQMESQLNRKETALVDRYHLSFALGKAFEDRQDFETAFKRYEQGNRLKLEECRYDADSADAAMRRQARVCTRELFEAKADMGAPHADPIFIVGLPRAGSTLLEQILASHSQVDGTMELPNIIALAHRLNGRRMLSDEAKYPALLSELDAATLSRLGDEFIRDTRIHRQDAPRFIDKMPNNFQHIGLIHLILPNARIIDARRHPMGCCFSGFKQLFADGQEFTYGQQPIGRYYRAYTELMKHWDEVLPGKVLRVHYEHVVADLETQVRRILEFLDLPFEESCLEFHRTDRSVRTPSSEQVRQPIYTSGVDQWRNFEPYLGELSSLLADLIEDYPQPPVT
jgi:tetratricopeptide (TPR) repeat protein